MKPELTLEMIDEAIQHAGTAAIDPTISGGTLYLASSVQVMGKELKDAIHEIDRLRAGIVDAIKMVDTSSPVSNHLYQTLFPSLFTKTDLTEAGDESGSHSTNNLSELP